MNQREFGAEGEAAARDYLVAHGARILEMNYRRPTGEIDIIAKKGRIILFVEVKRRTTLRFGRPAEAVNAAKRRHIRNTALLYLQEKRQMDARVRFDIIEIMPDGINHIENAFMMDE